MNGPGGPVGPGAPPTGNGPPPPAPGVSSLPLPPAQYIAMYTDDHVKRGKAPPPPPVIRDAYSVFSGKDMGFSKVVKYEGYKQRAHQNAVKFYCGVPRFPLPFEILFLVSAPSSKRSHHPTSRISRHQATLPSKRRS